MIVDPIDGTRGLMYQKRPAWILTGVAPNRGEATSLADIEVAVQTEIPLVKQHLCDQLWAIRGGGVHGVRHNRLTGEIATARDSTIDGNRPARTASRPSAASFPAGAMCWPRIDEELCERLLGPRQHGEAAVFEDQYASTGGQIYGLRDGPGPVRRRSAAARAADSSPSAATASGHCCHPYDLCTKLIAEEAGVIVTDPPAARDRAPLDTEIERRLDRLREPRVASAASSRCCTNCSANIG